MIAQFRATSIQMWEVRGVSEAAQCHRAVMLSDRRKPTFIMARG